MAVSATPSPSGFSYAQAAKGRASNTTSQAPSKVNSGSSTPAAAPTESGSAWSSVETSEIAARTDAVSSSAQEQARSGAMADDSRASNGTHSLAAVDTTLHSVEKASEGLAGNGTTDVVSTTTWETKSQVSEGNWIADREKRQQSTTRGPETSGKTVAGKGVKSQSKEAKEPGSPRAAQPPPVLHDAPAPAVNPWTKRAEDAKARTLVSAEVTRPKTDVAKKSQTPTPENARDAASEPKRLVDGKRPSETRMTPRQGTRSGTEVARSDAPFVRPGQREYQSMPNVASASAVPPPPAKDETSWPTPESAQQEADKEAKEPKEATDTAEADGKAAAKPREKSKWTVLPVTPTIKWETEEMNRPPRGTERAPRGGSGARGRGGYRGAPGTFKGGDRASSRAHGPHNDGDEAPAADGTQPEHTDRDALPLPSRPARASSRSQSLDRRHPRSRASPPKGAADRTAPHQANAADARRTASPSKHDVAAAESANAKAADSAPRVNGVRDENGEGLANGEGPGRRMPSNSRRESRNLEGYSKDWSNGSTRGSKRGGRGRGGSREYSGGHQPAQSFANGTAEFPNSTSFSIPPSPSAYQSPRGAFAFQPQGRGGWRGTPRSPSIPLDGAFGGNRFPPFAHAGQMPPPLQTHYYPAVYDPAYNGMPMSAMPYAPVMDQTYLFDVIGTQLDYYFSVDNLLKDTFLRRQMDSQGFVLFDVIVNFNRIKQLSQDRDVIKAACLRSELIEIRTGDDGKDRLRKRDGWSQFVLPMDQREPASQNDGPKSLHRPEAPQYPPMWSMHQGFPYPRGPASAGPTGQPRRPFDAPPYAVNSMVAPFSPFVPAPQDAPAFAEDHGEAARGRTAKSPARDSSNVAVSTSADSKPAEPDAFPDHRISELNVIYKLNPNPGRAGYHAHSSRTFSNGSIDSRNIASEIEKLSEPREHSLPNGTTAANGEAHAHNGSNNGSGVTSTGKDASEVIFLWLKDQEFHQDDVPKDTHVQPYFALRSEAFSQRDRAPRGSCPQDLDMLYKFWSHFLIRNFNSRMYGEFKFYATDDAKQRDSIEGLTHLVNFYVNALKSNTHIIRDPLVVDYIALVKDQPANFQNYAFKQLRQAWRDGATNLKNRKKLTHFVDESLRAQLES